MDLAVQSSYSHSSHALPPCHRCTRDAAPGHRRALVFHHLVQRPLRHRPLADTGLHLSADELSLVYRCAALVWWRVDAMADRRTRHRADDRRVARRRTTQATEVTTRVRHHALPLDGERCNSD